MSVTARVSTHHYVSQVGLPTGKYQVVPLYQGGAKGEPMHVEVVEGGATAISFGAEAVGGAEIRGDPLECADADHLSLYHIEAAGSLTLVARNPLMASCSWAIEGLRPGQSQVALQGRSGSGGRREFTVRTQSVSAIVLARPEVTVSGQVIYNGRPLAGARLEAFLTTNRAVQPDVVTIDAQGHYRMQLTAPGKYTFGIAGETGRRMPQTKTSELASGANTLDWSIRGGSMTVHLVGADPAAATRIVVTNQTATFNEIAGPGVTTVHREGLEFGQSLVYTSQDARQPRVSLGVQVAGLGEQNPESHVDLAMGTNSATIAVRGPAGERVDLEMTTSSRPGRASVQTGLTQGPRTDLSKAAAGSARVVSLASVPPGLPVLLRPPKAYVPICRVAPRDAAFDLTATTGKSVDLLVTVPHLRALSPVLGGLIGVEGSDCPVPLAQFDATPLSGYDEAYSAFRIHNFPLAQNLVWQVFRGRDEFRLPVHESQTAMVVLTFPR